MMIQAVQASNPRMGMGPWLRELAQVLYLHIIQSDQKRLDLRLNCWVLPRQDSEAVLVSNINDLVCRCVIHCQVCRECDVLLAFDETVTGVYSVHTKRVRFCPCLPRSLACVFTPRHAADTKRDWMDNFRWQVSVWLGVVVTSTMMSRLISSHMARLSAVECPSAVSVRESCCPLCHFRMKKRSSAKTGSGQRTRDG